MRFEAQVGLVYYAVNVKLYLKRKGEDFDARYIPRKFLCSGMQVNVRD